MKAKTIQTILFGKLNLPKHHILMGKIVKTYINRDMRLIMTGKLRCRLSNILPFRKSPSKILIIQLYRMELRQVKRNQFTVPIPTHKGTGRKRHELSGRHAFFYI